MKTIVGLIAASVLFVLSPTAQAQQVCAPRDTALMQLEEKFEEKVFGRGLAANGKRMIELFVSATGTWTMLATNPMGHSCVMASGENWQGIMVLVGDPV